MRGVGFFKDRDFHLAIQARAAARLSDPENKIAFAYVMNQMEQSLPQREIVAARGRNYGL
jgi:hypothetical protein